MNLEIENEENEEEFYEEDEKIETQPKKKKEESVEFHLNKIEKWFDEVIFDSSHEKYHLLTCQNNVKKGVIEKEVFLQLKIGKTPKRTTLMQTITYSNGKSTSEVVQELIEHLMDLKTNLLGNKESSSLVLQPTLFGEVETEVKDIEPDKDENFQKWLKWEDRKNKKLISEMNFVDIFDFRQRGCYLENDFSHLLPSESELIEIIKNKLIESKENKDIETFWFNVSRKNAFEPMSDYELMDKINRSRIDLIPYTRFAHSNYDNSYRIHSYDDYDDYRFRVANGIVSHDSHEPYENLPEYDIFSSDLLQFARDLFKIQNAEMMKDEEALDIVAKSLFCGINYHLDYYGYTDEMIQSHKDWKIFKSDIIKRLKHESVNGGGSGGWLTDGFSGSYTSHKTNPSLKVYQDTTARKVGNRQLDLKNNKFSKKELVVYELSGDEAFEAMYNAYNRDKVNKAPVQLGLFGEEFAA